ncbi:MAG: hypothetical protein M1822_008119 [Bathelium mastoideum]|nr:MAG: hypothetical protein M1822_008119 [Bathelium mastoideum]
MSQDKLRAGSSTAEARYGADVSEAFSPNQSQDAADLVRTGKKPVLKRTFGFTSVLGFSCISLSTWLGSYILLGVGYENGGPSGLVYGFILVWVGTLASFIPLAELASLAPTAGGQYHWVSILAPSSSQKLLSYVTGWLTVLGWQTSIAASTYITGELLQDFILLVDPSYVPQLWHSTLLFYAALAFAILVTTVFGPALSKVEVFLLILYVTGFFAILIPLIRLAPHSKVKDVFNTFINAGGWKTQGLSFMVGLSGNAFTFLGADSIYHMSEEIRDAARVVPKAMVTSLVLSGVVGLGAMIAVVFCLGNIEEVLNTQFNFPFVQVFIQATNSTAGTAVMVAVIIVLDLGLVISCVAAGSRQLWSFSRDRGVPGWSFFSKVSPIITVKQNTWELSPCPD